MMAQPMPIHLLTHMVPFAIDLLRRDGCIGVGACHVDMIGLDNLGHFIVDTQDGQALLVCIGEGSLELLMGCGQSLDRQWHDQYRYSGESGLSSDTVNKVSPRGSNERVKGPKG